MSFKVGKQNIKQNQTGLWWKKDPKSSGIGYIRTSGIGEKSGLNIEEWAISMFKISEIGKILVSIEAGC